MYLYLRLELWSVSTPKLTLSPTATATTTPAPSHDEDYLTSVVRMKELAYLEQSIVVEMNKVINKFGTTKVDSGSFANQWQDGLLKIKS